LFRFKQGGQFLSTPWDRVRQLKKSLGVLGLWRDNSLSACTHWRLCRPRSPSTYRAGSCHARSDESGPKKLGRWKATIGFPVSSGSLRGAAGARAGALPAGSSSASCGGALSAGARAKVNRSGTAHTRERARAQLTRSPKAAWFVFALVVGDVIAPEVFCAHQCATPKNRQSAQASGGASPAPATAGSRRSTTVGSVSTAGSVRATAGSDGLSRSLRPHIAVGV